jgi:hypothetical protein
MPVPNTRATQAQAEYASWMARQPGSPEALDAGRKFWFVKAVAILSDCMSRSPLPWTDEQRQEITDLLAGA